MLNIMLIDAQRNNRQRIRHYLEAIDEDFKIVAEVSSPDRGEAYLTSRSVDLMIGEDVVPNSQTCLQLFKAHEAQMPSLHGIFFSDSPIFNQSIETVADGRLDYLQKPVRKGDFTESFRRMALHIKDAKAKVLAEQDLKARYTEHLRTFQEGFLMNLIHGALRQDAYIYSQMDAFHIPYGKTFIAAIFKVDAYKKYALALDADERQFLIFKVYHLIQATMEKESAGIAFISRHDEVTLLFTTMDEQLDVLDFCLALHQEIHETLTLKGTIGIGRAYKKPKDLHLSYNQALDAILEHNYLGQDTVIHIDYVIGKNDLAYAYGPEQETMFCRYTVSGQLESALKTLQKILTALDRGDGYGPAFYRVFVQSLLLRIYRDGLAYDYALEAAVAKVLSPQEIAAVSDHFSAYTSLEKALKAITDYVKDKKVHRDQALLENALKYIQAYYTSRISLTSAAQYLMTTPKHLESIIYRVYQKTFYDFCMMVRIENAKDLLIKTRKSTAEVAVETGFTSTDYFVAIFRQYANETPSEYRHQNKNTAKPPIQLIRPNRSPYKR